MEQIYPPLRTKPYGGAWSIHDPEVINFMKGIKNNDGDANQFIHDYCDWIAKGKKINGLANFKHLNFSAGTTETFHMFYFRHIGKRLRLFKDEYFYHHMMARNYFKEFEVLQVDNLQKGDVVVMSCPFSNTGGMPENFYDILQKCETLGIPVLIDMAYINVSSIEEINLNFKCITTITTSLSKYFPVENLRIGIRLERDLYDDPLSAYNQNDYLNKKSVNVGHQLIKKYSNNWLMDKYRSLQLDSCNKLRLKPSDCVMFGLAEIGNFDEYNRNGDLNRLCFSRIWDQRIIL